MSNMTGSLKAPWVFGGCKVDWVSLVACPQFCPMASIVTMDDTVKITVTSDRGAFPDSKPLLDGIVKELTQTNLQK